MNNCPNIIRQCILWCVLDILHAEIVILSWNVRGGWLPSVDAWVAWYFRQNFSSELNGHKLKMETSSGVLCRSLFSCYPWRDQWILDGMAEVWPPSMEWTLCTCHQALPRRLASDQCHGQGHRERVAGYSSQPCSEVFTFTNFFHLSHMYSLFINSLCPSHVQKVIPEVWWNAFWGGRLDD